MFLRKTVLAMGLLLGLSTLATTAAAAGKIRIILLETMDVPVVTATSHACLSGLARLGYEDGKSAEILVLEAEGSRERATSVLREAMEQEAPNIVITLATLASQAAWDLLRNSGVPLVFGVVGDPVGAGIVPAIGKPSAANVTGLVNTPLRKTKVDLVRRILSASGRPKARFGCIHSSYPSSAGDLRMLREAAGKVGDITFVDSEIDYREMPKGLDAMMADARKRVAILEDSIDYWWLVAGALAEVPDLADLLAAESRHPVLVGQTMDHVRHGALMAIIPDREAAGMQLAALTDSILRGADPGEIPIRVPDAFVLGINLRTALDFGIVIPPEILKLAGKNVYR